MKKKHEKAMKSIEELRPKKYNYGPKQVVVMPSPVQKKDFTDYAYGMDIDEKVVTMAAKLAERMAISMVREMSQIDTNKIVDSVVAALSAKIVEVMPEQQTVIQQVVSSEMADLKSAAGELVFEGAELNIDRSKGLKLHGKVGETTTSDESTDDALDALDNLL